MTAKAVESNMLSHAYKIASITLRFQFVLLQQQFTCHITEINKALNEIKVKNGFSFPNGRPLCARNKLDLVCYI